MTDVKELTSGVQQLSVGDDDTQLSHVLPELSGGRRLPSRVRDVIERMIATRDERLIQALQGNYGLEATLARPIPICWQDAVIVHALGDLQPLIDTTFEGLDYTKAKELTEEENLTMTISRVNLVYGEVNFSSFATVAFKYLDLPPGGVFYDVGSGTGRGVFSAAFMHDFDRCTGIEIVQGLSRESQERLERFNTVVKPQMIAEAKERGEEFHLADINFIHSDFRDVSWTDATMVWANSTCFDTTLMTYLSNKSEEMKEGSYFVSLTKSLNSDHWELVTESKMYQMSWGGATLHTHVKVKPARPYRPDQKATEGVEEEDSDDGADNGADDGAGEYDDADLID